MVEPRPAGAVPWQPPDPAVLEAKRLLRREILTRRESMDDRVRADIRRVNAEHLARALTDVGTVCAFRPLRTEPVARGVLDCLAEHCRVLLPVVVGASPLDWIEHRPATTSGNAAPRLGPAAVATADVILVPALAISTTGLRLGRGGGHYDRTLSLARQIRRPPVRTIAVVGDDELLADVPHDALDMPVAAVVTPTGGVRALPLT